MKKSKLSVEILTALGSTCAFAFVSAPFASAQENTEEDEITAVEIVVTKGFRQSLNTALKSKRDSAAAIDAIVAEDIGKFPDSNLAESMQRIPGVALARGDNGEGRNISVRGLSAGFTRVRINGMEGSSQTGSSDIYGAGNFGRSFDFNVFPSEIFQSLTVRKTSSANIEEGSLGATVDLEVPRPLDFGDDFVATANVRGVQNELSESTDPRLSALVSSKFADGKVGVLATAAYSSREIREVGYSAVNILRASDDQGFCTPVGVTPQNPVDDPAKGTDADNCATGNPRLTDAEPYNEVFDRQGIAGVPGGGTFLPRLPRYVNSENSYDRTAATFTVQWAPDDETDVSFDVLFSEFDVLRRDSYIAAKSFGRNSNRNGKPMTSIRDIVLDENGSLVYGDFTGVDVRSESLEDTFITTFEQYNLNFERVLSDRLTLSGKAGMSSTVFDAPERLTVNIDHNDTDFAIDFRNNPNEPVLTFGFDIADPEQYCYALPENGNFCGYLTSRWAEATTDNQLFELDAEFTLTDSVTLKGGIQFRESDYHVEFRNLVPEVGGNPPLQGGVQLADVTTLVTGFRGALGGNAPDEWVRIDHAAWKEAVGWNDFETCGTECGQYKGGVKEGVTSIYGMLEFDSEWGVPVRGDIGFRFLTTDQTSAGTIATTAPPGHPYPNISQPNTVTRDYDDFLPSANIVFNLQDDLLLRMSAARVMARGELGDLQVGGGVNPTTHTGSTNNPYLDPVRANTFDTSIEWYFQEGALLSAAIFYKDIESYIQRITSDFVYTELGLPLSLLEGSVSLPTDTFTISRVTNTDGGPLQGMELSLQTDFTALPGLLANTGMLASYTYVSSDIDYVLQSEDGVPTLTTTDDLIGLSETSWSLTLYYEDDRFSFRTTGNYRDDFIRAIPSGAPDSDILGNKDTFYVDATMSYAITDQIRINFDMQNLTDERNELFIDRARRDPLFETRIGRTFSLGASFEF